MESTDFLFETHLVLELLVVLPSLRSDFSSETLDSLSDLEPQYNSFTIDSETETAMPQSRSPSGSQREHQSRSHSPAPSNTMSERQRAVHQNVQEDQTLRNYTEEAEHPDDVLWIKYGLAPLETVTGETPVEDGKEFPLMLTQSEIKKYH